MIKRCAKSNLVGYALGEFCGQCQHCVGMHDKDGKCIVCENSVSVIRVQPGDVIVVKSKERLSHDLAKLLWEWAAEMWPDNKTGIMNGADVEVEIVRPESA